jgi:hypothetical protein
MRQKMGLQLFVVQIKKLKFSTQTENCHFGVRIHELGQQKGLAMAWKWICISLKSWMVS